MDKRRELVQVLNLGQYADVEIYQTILTILAKRIMGQRYKSEETIKLAGTFASRRGLHSYVCLVNGGCCFWSIGRTFVLRLLVAISLALSLLH